MKNTSHVGNVTVGRILVTLAEKGKIVLTPFGEGCRYDLLIDEGEKFVRVQCKTGKLKRGCVVFKNYSVTAAGSRCYGTAVDAYGVYCPQNKKCYFVPAKDCASFETCLRVEPAKNGMKKNIRFAKDFEL
jgi:PD-(D/E)XK endonuclease